MDTGFYLKIGLNP